MTDTPSDPPPHPPTPPGYPPPGGYQPAGPAPGGYPWPGSYPPPSPYTAGGFPYPPPPGGYGPMPGYGPPPYDVGDGLRWAWNVFRPNAVRLITAILIWGVSTVALAGVPYVLAFALSEETPATLGDSGEAHTTMRFGVVSVVLVIFAVVALFLMIAASTSAVTSGVLKAADGQPTTLSSFLTPRRLGAVLALQLVIYAAVLVGFLLCLLPGIAVGFFTLFAVTALLDRNLSLAGAIKASINVVKTNFGPVFLMWLVLGALNVAGQFACLVGLLVTIPLGILFQVYTYRRLSGGTLAPAGTW